jgi:3-oxoacyl-[acyl-carrier-protein] synthase II
MQQRYDYNQVVITGLGAVTPLGIGKDALWEGLLAGRRGLSTITKFDPSGLRNERAGQVNDWHFDAAQLALDQQPDEATQFLLTALGEAVADADLTRQLTRSSEPQRDVGCVLGTNFGGSMSWEDYMATLIAGEPSPAAFADFTFHRAIDTVAATFAVGGPSGQLSMACASGTAAIAYAADLIRIGHAEVVLVAGYDSLAPSHLSGLSLLHTISEDDLYPFSGNRSGTVFGEGAGALVLENSDHARRRNIRCYCEVLGGAQNNNAYHLTAPDAGGAGMAKVLANAIGDAGIHPDQINHINAHGTGTEYHDVAETQAIKQVLGSAAYSATVVSIKGATLHLMGAAGAVEGLVTALSIFHQTVPPTTNYAEPDPECDLDYVIEGARQQTIQHAASISAGIGGDNACVVFARTG